MYAWLDPREIESLGGLAWRWYMYIYIVAVLGWAFSLPVWGCGAL